MQAPRLTEFEVGQILTLRREGYSYRDIAGEVLRSEPKALAKDPYYAARRLVGSCSQGQRADVFCRECPYYGGSRLVGSLNLRRKISTFNSLRFNEPTSRLPP
jgi:hypothetical protein